MALLPCVQCGGGRRNDLFGDRCEDCYADNRAASQTGGRPIAPRPALRFCVVVTDDRGKCVYVSGPVETAAEVPPGVPDLRPGWSAATVPYDVGLRLDLTRANRRRRPNQRASPRLQKLLGKRSRRPREAK